MWISLFIFEFLVKFYLLIPLSSLNRQECNEWKEREEKISFSSFVPKILFSHELHPSFLSSSKILSNTATFNKMDFLSYRECFSYQIRLLERVSITCQATKLKQFLFFKYPIINNTNYIFLCLKLYISNWYCILRLEYSYKHSVYIVVILTI